MSEKPNSLINIPDLPPSVDNAIKNATDKPTQNIGNTLADIWYILFGGISHTAEKKRIKYDALLEQYRAELTTSVSNIPAEKRIEPSIQVTAQALDNSNYCIEEKELREMFVSLISNSMNSDYREYVHPSFAEIIKQMSPLDANIIKCFKGSSSDGLLICQYNLNDSSGGGITTLLDNVFIDYPTSSLPECSLSISSLIRLGLLQIDYETIILPKDKYMAFREHSFFQELQEKYPNQTVYVKDGRVWLTPLGQSFVKVCIPD